MSSSHSCQFSVIAALPPPFPLLSFPFTPPSFLSPSVFPMDCLPIDSNCICTSFFILPPPSHHLILFTSISLTDFRNCILYLTLDCQHTAGYEERLSGKKSSSKWQ